MKPQPFYHLRPNKFIDRHLFIQMLGGLRKIYPIEKYQYVGFGSFLFDDFKILHNNLGLSDMISLESDADICKRAEFNKPYKCISVQNTTSSDYIANAALEKATIFWLDYTAPSELGSQLADFCTLVGKMKAGDIIRITLNANPSALDDGEPKENDDQIHDGRLAKLKSLIDEYIPSDTAKESMTYNGYPQLLLSCLRNAAGKTLSPSQYQRRRLMPLFSSCYADGQQMITLTAIVIDNEYAEGRIKECLKLHDYVNCEWDSPCLIQAPELTAKETIHINNALPIKRSIKTIKDKYGFAFQNGASLEDAIMSYVKYYKYYPNFHHVSL